MLTPRKLGRRLRALLLRPRLERELDEELEFHIDMQTRKHMQDGMDEKEARRRARVEFGALQRFREETREARGVGALEDLIRDLRFGVRVLAKRPGFTSVVLATLALGVGGSAAIFGAVNGILLRPLPFPEADRLVKVWESDHATGDDRVDVSPANFLDWRERNRSFERIVSVEPYGFDWQRPEGPIYLPAWMVSEGFFETMGVPALHGRAFRSDEHVQGAGAVVVLGHALWLQRFAGDPEVVGTTLDLDGNPVEVIGVMPEGFAQPSDDSMWAPKVWAGWEAQARTSNFYEAYARLGDGVTLEQAQSEMDSIAAQLAAEYPGSNSDSGIALEPLPEQMLGRVRQALMLLLGAVGLVLLVVTANIASMQLARAVGRGREFAVRGALGAGRFRVARELLTENLLIAGAGAALGFGVAQLALRFLRSIAPGDLPRAHEMTADVTVLGFALLVSLLAVLSTGLLPTAMATRTRLSTSLTEGGRSSTGGRWVGRMQAGLVVTQITLSLMLLIGAGLLVRSFVTLLNVDRGFHTDGIIAGGAQAWHQDPADNIAFTREVLDNLRGMPGVTAAGMTSSMPFMRAIGPDRSDLTLTDQPLGPDESAPSVQFSTVTPGYFEAMGIPLTRGRMFDTRDGADGQLVALVNEAFVDTFWAELEPLGQRLGISPAGPPVELEVVGVVGDVRRHALHQEPDPAVYIARGQSGVGANVFVVRGTGAPAGLQENLRQAVLQVNPTLALSPEAALADLVGESVQERRFLMALLAGFAAMALCLAAAGIFGLMSYAIAERRREIGVRMALGADRTRVVRLVLRSGTALAVIGVVLGSLAALALTRILAGMLYGVTPLDPVTFLLSAAVLVVAALLASSIPAWWAARTDPVGALRAE